MEEIKEAYDDGQLHFGESRVQELEEKQPLLPADIEWHFVGSLQRNKVRFIAPFVSLVHSLDSARLMREIDNGRILQKVSNGRVRTHWS